MSHKAVFFNLEKLGREHMLQSALLKDADVSLAFEDRVLEESSIPERTDFDIAGVFVDSHLTSGVMERLPDLKCIATLSTGFDHIDLGAAASHGIVVSSVPSYGEQTVAEYAFALILAISRKICEGETRVRDERKFTIDGLRGFDLSGKTIGVVGTGHIGQHVIKIAKGFGMNVVAFDLFKNEALAKNEGFEYMTLGEVLSKSDVVSLHLPATPETYHIIGRESLTGAKKGLYLINTGRGSTVDVEALVEAIKDGRVAGAGIDVLEREEALKTNGLTEPGDATVNAIRELVGLPNVIVTPHNAFNSEEAFLRILDTTIENIVNFTKGTPGNIVKS